MVDFDQTASSCAKFTDWKVLLIVRSRCKFAEGGGAWLRPDVTSTYTEGTTHRCAVPKTDPGLKTIVVAVLLGTSRVLDQGSA